MERSSKRKSLGAWFLMLDIFGMRVDLTFKGQSRYRTPGGAILTVFVAALMGIYAVITLSKLITNESTIIGQFEFGLDMTSLGEISETF